MINDELTRDHTISWFGEFTSKDIESTYFNSEINKVKHSIRLMMLYFGILYFLFFIADYFLIQNINTFYIILSSRSFFLMMVIILYYCSRLINNNLLTYVLTAYQIVVSILFLYIYYQYESPIFLIQAIGVIMIIIMIFMVPNRWANTLFVSLFIYISFFVMSIYFIDKISFRELFAAIIYILLIIILSSVSSLRTNIMKRTQYLQQKKLIKLAETDPLTGLYNRMKFDKELNNWVQFSKRYNAPLSLVLFDIDDFKHVNDKYGHLNGDKVITQIVTLIKGQLRETDVFARWGGEEFMILLPHTDLHDAITVTKRFWTTVSEYVYNDIGVVTCSFSVVFLSTEDTINTFLKRADKLLYSAKASGKNIVVNE